MSKTPPAISDFLSCKRLAVAGVSRQTGQAANAIYQKLKRNGYQVFPVNPNASVVEGDPCFPDIAALPPAIDGVVIATAPGDALEVVRQCRQHGIPRVWFHRSFGEGSVSQEALDFCEAEGIDFIGGGCPLMFCEPVDLAHKCMRWFLQRRGKVPVS